MPRVRVVGRTVPYATSEITAGRALSRTALTTVYVLPSLRSIVNKPVAERHLQPLPYSDMPIVAFIFYPTVHAASVSITRHIQGARVAQKNGATISLQIF